MRKILKTWNKQEGFTILEILIATTISLFLVLILCASIVMGLSLVQKGENWTEQKVKDSSVMDSFYQQVATSRPYYREGNSIHFEGTPTKVVFVTPFSLTSGYGKGLVEASYYVVERALGSVDLLYKERRMGPGSLSISSKGHSAEELVLLNGCSNITFEYLLVKEGRKTWISTWQEKELPEAVSLRFVKGGESQRIVASMLAMSLSSPSGEL